MKKILIISFLVPFLFTSTSKSTSAPEPLSKNSASTILRLTLGQRTPLTEKINSLWIQDKKILQAEQIGSKVVLNPKGVGETLIGINGRPLRVLVMHPLQKQLTGDFEKIVVNIPGLQIQSHSSETIVDGQFFRKSDWELLTKQAKKNHRKFKIAAKFSPTLKNEMQIHLDQLFIENGLRPQNLVFGSFLEIRLSSKHPHFSKIDHLLENLGIDLVSDDSQIINAPTISVHVTVAEMQKSVLRTLGVQWPSSVSLNPDFQVMKENLKIDLNALENSSKAQVLASPNLICQSGQEAEFLAGGEFPVKFVSYKQKEIIWKKYGVLLKVNPLADSSGRINLKLDAEVSEISDIVEGIPSLKTNRVSSTFNLSESQTIILSGLLQNQGNKSVSGWPTLKDIPILGKLFSSENFLNKQTELVIFVRPEIQNEFRQSLNKPSHLTEYKEQE